MSKTVVAHEKIAPVSGKVEGTVEFFNKKRGFGFIKVDDQPRGVFIHAETLREHGIETLDDNQKVIVEWGNGAKGRAVAHITV